MSARRLSLMSSCLEVWLRKELHLSPPTLMLWAAESPLESCESLILPIGHRLCRSWHLSISSAYFIAWVVVAVIFQQFIYKGTNIVLLIVLYVVTGLSLASWTFIVAVPFASAPTLAAITCETKSTTRRYRANPKPPSSLSFLPLWRSSHPVVRVSR